jgi:hypothetical protein
LYNNGHHVIVLKQLSSNFTNTPYIYLSENEEWLGTWEGGRTLTFHGLSEELSVYGRKPGLLYVKGISGDQFLHMSFPRSLTGYLWGWSK